MTTPGLNVASLLAALLVLASCATATTAPQSDENLVVAWNAEILEVAEAEDRFLTLKGVRAAAMMHLAMHDAVNAVDPHYATWLHPTRSPIADPIAAATEAAFQVAIGQYPEHEVRLRRVRNRWLARVNDGPAKNAGLRLGTATASAIMASRQGDAWDAEATYEWHPMAPGVYAEFSEHSGTPEGFVFGAGWARARPFTLDDPAQFRAPPPPPISSDGYTRAFDEVREVGAENSSIRTQDQTHLAMWWKEFVESSHNRLARRLAVEDRLDLCSSTRLFALLNMSVFDAYVSVFDSKFFYNHWRPYTAIRFAGDDGNPDTHPDPDWNNLHRHTYAFPSYPSAHGAACAAAMTVLAETFGDARPVTMTTTHVDRAGPLSEKIVMQPSTRRFENFSAAAVECSLSRVYLGIHFRYDSVAGTELGRAVGAHVVSHALARN